MAKLCNTRMVDPADAAIIRLMDLEWMVVAYPFLERIGRQRCQQKELGFTCTRLTRHVGPHVRTLVNGMKPVTSGH